jgi:hypothetical protein
MQLAGDSTNDEAQSASEQWLREVS